jgi:uncharacterized protein (TIGR03435 family)
LRPLSEAIALAQAAIAISEVRVQKTTPRVSTGVAVSSPVINGVAAAKAVNAQGNTKSLAFPRISLHVSSTFFKSYHRIVPGRLRKDYKLTNCADTRERRLTPWISFVALLTAVGPFGLTARAQSAADSDQTFEVATIKPGNGDARGFGIRFAGHRFTAVHTSLSDLIAFAYGLHPGQITGGPDWVLTEKYDLQAEAGGDGKQEGKPTTQAMRTMVQKLLADRCRLTFHRDTKILSVYAIVVGKSGPKFLNSPGDPNGNAGYGFKALGAMTVNNARIADFAGWMQRFVMDRPVVDRTGIAGRYDFSLNWTPDETQFAGMADQLPPETGNVEPPDLYTAMQEQLGLKLEAAKDSVEILAIDHVERPSGN